MGEAWIGAAALCIALAVDRWCGEPTARWHPVVWMGRFLGFAGRRIAPLAGGTEADDWQRFAAGAIAWCAGAAVVLTVALAAQALIARWPAAIAALALGLALKPLLAWRLLRQEVLVVEARLVDSIEEGRARLARLASRDVGALDEVEVREGAIESLAENLNDSVVAPIFWFVVFGLPGAAVYRFANTADAMWGYRGTRDGRDWTWAGRWAARVDDVLSWAPARLTAILLLLCSLRPGIESMVALPREARRTPSPNGGWPMAAMALLLGVRLGKPGVYLLNGAGRAAGPEDTRRAARLGARVVGLMVAIASAAMTGAALSGTR